ncbi:hypothetical protein H5410_014641 [Solanum commersonii]|uniref:Uncharacterized protein n=1 Tax=Solanum commersonii TaxID=4109 RepID=A0A9J5ZRH8_SOLCO|nr:hypothetical protein H5410_014641 [Solanum commersonii]
MKTSAAKLIVDALLQRFLPLARRRIETAQAQDGQYLRPSDPAYEQVLDSLAMIARHTPGPLLEALLRWRERRGQKSNLFIELENYAKKEEIAWRQRSRTLWIYKGDKHTKFFQRIANACKRKNHIDLLRAISGLHIKGSKSLIFPINEVARIQQLTEIWVEK